jgi:hypothetical protein
MRHVAHLVGRVTRCRRARLMGTTSPPTIAAALITKDSLGVIEPCLDSILPHVDELNVYDTGSTDGTVEFLQSLEQKPSRDDAAVVRVVRGEWRDDFAWAREQSFGLVSPGIDWVLWLDDDDVVVGGERLRELVSNADPMTDGLLVFYDYARNEQGTTVMQLWRERLVRRDRGFRWHGAIHEWLGLADGRVPKLVAAPQDAVRIVHMRPPGRDKTGRNLHLLQDERERADAAQVPVAARTLDYLAAEHIARQEYAEAIPLLEEYLRRGDDRPDERAHAYHRLAKARLLAGDPEGAVTTELESLAERDDWAETAAGLAEAYAALDRWDLVEVWAKRTLELGVPRSTIPINPLELSFAPMMHLAEACFRSDRVSEGLEWLERAWKVR